MRSRLLTVPIAICVSLLGMAPVHSQALDQTEMLRFLVQAQCLDDRGAPTTQTPIDPGCTRRRAQTADDPAAYRRSDWNDARHPAYAASGHQASDAVLTVPPAREGGPITVAHTYDFGHPGGAGFGAFDLAYGDGGDVMTLERGIASIFMTQDGGGGLQWFVGEGCRQRRVTQDRAWLLFSDTVTPSVWTDGIARLLITKARNECPRQFSSAYTRWIRDQIAFPFRRSGASAGEVSVDAIVSEHYDLPTIEASTHLERFYFARDMGKLRWERWEHRPTDGEIAQRAANLQASARCPTLRRGEPPGPDWFMIDCRMWTNLIPPPPGGWSVGQYGWTGLTTAAR
jgi:hypothetical protein